FARGGLQPLHADGRGIPLLAIFDRPAWPCRPAHHAHPAVPAVIPSRPSSARQPGHLRTTDGFPARPPRSLTAPRPHRLTTHNTKLSSRLSNKQVASGT